MSYIEIGILIFITIILGKIAKKLKISEVVGQLLSGIILGVSFLNVVHATQLIHTLAEIGIFMLMFNSGMSSDIKAMRKYIKASMLVAVMGVVVPAMVFPIAFLLLGYSLNVSLFAGVVFSATSISITLAVLAEQKKLATTMGAVILSAAVVDDVIALIAVMAFSIIFGGGTLGVGSILPLIAFALGIFLGKTSFAVNLTSVSNHIGDRFLYPIFFGAIGLEVTIQGLSNKLIPIAVFSVLAIMTKFSGSFIGAKIAGINTPVANAIGAGMISRGEMALIITQIGLSSHMIDESISGEFIVTIIISTIVAPIIMKPLFTKVSQN